MTCEEPRWGEGQATLPDETIIDRVRAMRPEPSTLSSHLCDAKVGMSISGLVFPPIIDDQDMAAAELVRRASRLSDAFRELAPVTMARLPLTHIWIANELQSNDGWCGLDIFHMTAEACELAMRCDHRPESLETPRPVTNPQTIWEHFITELDIDIPLICNENRGSVVETQMWQKLMRVMSLAWDYEGLYVKVAKLLYELWPNDRYVLGFLIARSYKDVHWENHGLPRSFMRDVFDRLMIAEGGAKEPTEFSDDELHGVWRALDGIIPDSVRIVINAGDATTSITVTTDVGIELSNQSGKPIPPQ